MKSYYVVSLGGINYYFNKKVNLIKYFLLDCDLLYKALDNYKLIEIEDYEVDDLREDSNNLFYNTDFKSEVSLRQLNNFNYLSKSLNFKSLVIDFVERSGIREENIDEASIFALKKRILLKSKSLPELLKALEVDDSILKYFLIKKIRKSKQ